jgi:hypothetical protein
MSSRNTHLSILRYRNQIKTQGTESEGRPGHHLLDGSDYGHFLFPNRPRSAYVCVLSVSIRFPYNAFEEGLTIYIIYVKT